MPDFATNLMHEHINSKRLIKPSRIGLALVAQHACDSGLEDFRDALLDGIGEHVVARDRVDALLEVVGVAMNK